MPQDQFSRTVSGVEVKFAVIGAGPEIRGVPTFKALASVGENDLELFLDSQTLEDEAEILEVARGVVSYLTPKKKAV